MHWQFLIKICTNIPIIYICFLSLACTPTKNTPTRDILAINSECYEFLGQDTISLAWSCFNLVQDLGRTDLATQGRANIFLLKQQYSQAKREFQESLNFGNLLSLYGLAACNEKLGLIAEAKLNYWQLVSEFKEEAMAYHNFGLFMEQHAGSEQELELAKESLIRAKILNQDPKLKEYYNQLLSSLD